MVAEDSRLESNHRRPHSSLGHQTPAAFAVARRVGYAAHVFRSARPTQRSTDDPHDGWYINWGQVKPSRPRPDSSTARRALGWASVLDMQAEREGCILEAESPQTAGDVMQNSVRTAGVSTVLRVALRLMLDERIHSLPVVDAQCLKGIVTETDFLRAFARKALL